MSGIADELVTNNPEAAATRDVQSLHEHGAGEEQTSRPANYIAGEAECLQDSIRNTPGNPSSNFMDFDDMELLSWLQHPLDDVNPSGQKHWPPPLSTSAFPASPDFVCIPASSVLAAVSLLPSLSSSSSSSSSISAVNKHFPQLKDEASMDGRDLDTKAVNVFEWSVQKELLAEKSEFGPGEQSNMMSGIQGAGGYDQGSMLDDKRTLRCEQNRAAMERVAGVWAGSSNRQTEPMLDELKPQIGHTAEPVLEELKPRFENIASNIKEPWLMKDVAIITNTEVAFATPRERLQAHLHVNAALALGAGRAAGTIKPVGIEAFTQLRTSHQPVQPCNPLLGPPSPFSLPNLTGKSLCLSNSTSAVASRALGSSAPRQVNEITELHDLARLYATKIFAESFNNGLQKKKQSEDHKIMGKYLMRTHAKSSHAEPSAIGPVSNLWVEQPKEGTSNVSAADDTFASTTGAMDLQKLSWGSLLSQEEEVLAVSGGGSETTGSLRERVSGSKRKLEDLENQSELEAEGESGLISQARTSTSKRSQANEGHNLSERRRRNRINEKMSALRQLIPNASKSNKAALLDDAIVYLKNLQLQLQVLSSRTGMSLAPMPLPTTQHHLQALPYSSLHVMGNCNYMGAGSASSAANGSSTLGSMHSSYVVPGRPYNTLQQLSTPMSAVSDWTTLQPELSVSHHQAPVFPAAQAHHQLYVQPSHQGVSQVAPTNKHHLWHGGTYHQQQQQQQQQLHHHLHHHYHRQQQQHQLQHQQREVQMNKKLKY